MIISPFNDRGILRGTGYALAFLCLLFQVELAIFISLDTAIHRDEELTITKKLSHLEDLIKEELHLVLTDLEYLTNGLDSSKFLTDNSQDSKEDLEIFLSIMSRQIGKYDQIRLIDQSGFEKMRLDWLDSSDVQIISGEDLQDKSDRYYVRETSLLGPDETYVSSFDLNVEHGMVEVPVNPMIRFGKKIYSRENEWIGMGMLNYRGRLLIDMILEEQPEDGSNIYLVNKNGYYLHSPWIGKNWSFMFPMEPQEGFFIDFPYEWGKIRNEETSRQFTTNGLFMSRKVEPLNMDICDQCWYLVFHQTTDIFHRTDKFLIIGLLLGAIFLSPLLVWVGIRLGRSSFRENMYVKKIESLALQDSMTGLLNRRAVYDIITRDLSEQKKNPQPYSLGYIDVDNLKFVNDSQGHEAGDILISKAAESMQKTIRDTDIAARVGGDEFLIAFPGCTKQQAHDILERADKRFRNTGFQYTGKEWTMSYGSSQYMGNGDNLEDMIQRADKEMYAYKRKMKKGRDQ